MMLRLGQLALSSGFIQGPLAGVSTAPFRVLVSRYSQPAFTCTEMISCQTLLHQSKAFLRRFIYKDPNEGKLCFQLSGNRPAELAAAIEIAEEAGADLIDLNCGCPVKKIRTKGAGSRLLSQPMQLFNLIYAMRKAARVPVSIKIRVDGESGEQFNQDIANAVNDAGVDFLIVHGRHWSEKYDTTCRYQQIAFFVNAVKCPVIGNGDVADLPSLQKMLATGCAGVMVSRGSVGRPWLIAQLRALQQQNPYDAPQSHEVGAVFKEHIESLANLLASEKMAVLHARKLSKYYARELPNKLELIQSINDCLSLNSFNLIVDEYFTQRSQRPCH